MFLRRHKDQAKPHAKQQSAEQQYAAETPDVGLQKARQAYFETVGTPVVTSARFFLISMLLGVIALCQGIAIFHMLPLKEVRPWVVAVDNLSGEVRLDRQAAQSVDNYKPERPVLDRELFSFVKNLYMMNADAEPVVVEAQTEAYNYTRDKASAQFREFIAKEQPYQRMRATPGLTRTVERGTMTYREDANVVLIRYTTLERNRAQVEPVRVPWVMQATYTRVQPTDRAEIERNPLGIYITHFEIEQERR